MYTIYKIVNIQNGKIYIGQTNRPLKVRFDDHCQRALTNGLNTCFSRAIRKYGKENFIIEPIEENIKTKEDANKREIYFISKYDSTNKNIGYNSSPGGEGGNTYINKTPKELKEIGKKISKSLSGENNGKHTVIYMKDVETDIEIRFGSFADCERYLSKKYGHIFTRRTYDDYAKWNQKYGIQPLLFGRYIFRFENDEYYKWSKFPKHKSEGPYLIKNLETNEVFIGICKRECFEHFGLHVSPSGRCDIKFVPNTYITKKLKPYEYKEYLE